jgi:hypothetical protein
MKKNSSSIPFVVLSSKAHLFGRRYEAEKMFVAVDFSQTRGYIWLTSHEMHIYIY